MGWKISLSVISGILGLFVNTLTANGRYSLLHKKKLQQPIRTKLSKKQKKFCQYFLDFCRLHQVFNILKINMILIADVFLKLQSAKGVVTQMSKKSKIPFDSQHIEWSQTLLKSARQHFYHILSSLWQSEKTPLDKFLKSLVWEHPSTVNILMGAKDW